MLRVIQEQEIPRVGSSNTESVDVGLIAAKTPAVDANSGKMTLVDVEREHIEKALRYFNFQINKTAQFSGIDRKTLRTRIRNYGINKVEE